MLLYIDPGTGSMLFTVLIGVIGAAVYSFKMLWIKIKFAVGGGKAEANLKKIPFVIFSDDKRYWNVFEPICREMNNRGQKIVYMTSSKDDPALTCEYECVKAEYIGSDNKAFMKLNFLNASIVLSTTPGLDVYQWKRSKDVDYYVHIFHAANDVTLYRMFGIDYYDALLISGEYQAQDIRELEKMRNLPQKELVKVGIPYMDVMAERLRNVQNDRSLEGHQRTVLLAPSWGPGAILSVYGDRIIEELLKTGYHVIVRPHPQSFVSEKAMLDKLMADYPESENLEWNRDNDNFEVLSRSDIMISDFSGVIFDFTLIYDKPVIYTNPQFDVSVYDAWWLKKPLWTSTALARLGRELNEDNMSDLKGLIDSCVTDSSYSDGRVEVKNETWEHAGEGALRVTDYLISKYNELTNTEKEK